MLTDEQLLTRVLRLKATILETAVDEFTRNFFRDYLKQNTKLLAVKTRKKKEQTLVAVRQAPDDFRSFYATSREFFEFPLEYLELWAPPASTPILYCKKKKLDFKAFTWDPR